MFMNTDMYILNPCGKESYSYETEYKKDTWKVQLFLVPLRINCV